MEGLIEIVNQIGWAWGLVIYIMIREIIPFLKEVVTNERRAQVNRDAEAASRMYQLLDKFSDRLSSFSTELSKQSMTNLAILNRLESLENRQESITTTSMAQKEALERISEALLVINRKVEDYYGK